MKTQSKFSIRMMLLLTLVFGVCLFLTLSASGKTKAVKKTAGTPDRTSATAKKPVKKAPPKNANVSRSVVAKKTGPASVTTAPLPTTAGSTATPAYSGGRSPFAAFSASLKSPATTPTSSLVSLFNQLTMDTTSKKRGDIGVGAIVFLKGHVLAGVTLEKPLYYYSLGGGMYINPIASTVRPDVVLYGGAGVTAKSRVSVGGIVTLTLLSVPTYKTAGNQIERVNSKKPSLDFGVQGNFELKKHLWVSATVHRQFGVGVGATYFF